MIKSIKTTLMLILLFCFFSCSSNIKNSELHIYNQDYPIWIKHYEIIEDFLDDHNVLTHTWDTNKLTSFLTGYIYQNGIILDDSAYNKLKFKNQGFKLLAMVQHCTHNFDKPLWFRIIDFLNIDYDVMTWIHDKDLLQKHYADQCQSPVFYDFYSCQSEEEKHFLTYLVQQVLIFYWYSDITDTGIVSFPMIDRTHADYNYLNYGIKYFSQEKIQNIEECFTFLE